MIRKYGSHVAITKIASNMDDVLNDPKLKKAIENKSEDDLYMLTRLMTANKPNSNYDFFSDTELKKAYKGWINKGLYINHSQTDDVSARKGVIVNSWFIDEDPDDIHIVILGRISKECEPELSKKILHNVITSVSMGTSCSVCRCSACGHEAHTEKEYCDCMKNHLGEFITRASDGKKVQVYSINEGLDPTECSFVSNPADESANLISVWAQTKNKELVKKIASDCGIEVPTEIESTNKSEADMDKKVAMNEELLKKYFEMSKNTNINEDSLKEFEKFVSENYVSPHVEEIARKSKTVEEFLNKVKKFERSASDDKKAGKYYFEEKGWKIITPTGDHIEIESPEGISMYIEVEGDKFNIKSTRKYGDISTSEFNKVFDSFIQYVEEHSDKKYIFQEFKESKKKENILSKNADNGQYKSDEDIAKEFEGMTIDKIEINEWKGGDAISGGITMHFPNAGESVGGGQEGDSQIWDSFIVYDYKEWREEENGYKSQKEDGTGYYPKIALNHWYSDNAINTITDAIMEKLIEYTTNSLATSKDASIIDTQPTDEQSKMDVDKMIEKQKERIDPENKDKDDTDSKEHTNVNDTISDIKDDVKQVEKELKNEDIPAAKEEIKDVKKDIKVLEKQVGEGNSNSNNDNGDIKKEIEKEVKEKHEEHEKNESPKEEKLEHDKKAEDTNDDSLERAEVYINRNWFTHGTSNKDEAVSRVMKQFNLSKFEAENVWEIVNLDMTKKGEKKEDVEPNTIDLVIYPEDGETVEDIANALQGLDDIGIKSVEKNADNVVVTVMALTPEVAEQSVSKALTEMGIHVNASKTQLFNRGKDKLVRDICGETIRRSNKVTIEGNKGEFTIVECFEEDGRDLVMVNYNGVKKSFASKIVKKIKANQDSSNEFYYYINMDERGEFNADVRDGNDKTVWETDGSVFEDGFMKNKNDISGLKKYLVDMKIMKDSDILIHTGNNKSACDDTNKYTVSENKTADNTIRLNDTVNEDGNETRYIVTDIDGDEITIEMESSPYEEKTVNRDKLVKVGNKTTDKKAGYNETGKYSIKLRETGYGQKVVGTYLADSFVELIQEISKDYNQLSAYFGAVIDESNNDVVAVLEDGQIKSNDKERAVLASKQVKEGNVVEASELKSFEDIAEIIMDGKEFIQTEYGKKSKQGITEMLKGGDDSVKAIFNGKEFIQTSYGKKRYEGIDDMVGRMIDNKSNVVEAGQERTRELYKQLDDLEERYRKEQSAEKRYSMQEEISKLEKEIEWSKKFDDKIKRSKVVEAGYSTTNIDKDKALSMSKGWEVVSASHGISFTDNKWRKNVVSAELKEDNNTIFFTLKGGDFVEVEKVNTDKQAKATEIKEGDYTLKYYEDESEGEGVTILLDGKVVEEGLDNINQAKEWIANHGKDKQAGDSVKDEFKVGDIFNTQGNTNMADPIKIREIIKNTIKFTDAKGIEYGGMQRSVVRDLVNGGSWKKVPKEPVGENKQAADPIPPKPDDSTLSSGMKWVFNRDSKAWEQKPQGDATVDVTAGAIQTGDIVDARQVTNDIEASVKHTAILIAGKRWIVSQGKRIVAKYELSELPKNTTVKDVLKKAMNLSFKKHSGKLVWFDVMLNGKEIDSVPYDESMNMSEEEVKGSLINHDGYDSNIEVVKHESKKTADKKSKEETEVDTRDVYEADSDDIILLIENDSSMYDSQYIPIYKNLSKKKLKGTYDSSLAPKLFMYIVNEGAKKWYAGMKEWADDGNSVVIKPTLKVKEKAAKEMAKTFEQSFESKEYDFMKEPEKKVEEKKAEVGYHTYKVVECGTNDYPFTVTEDNVEIDAFATKEEAESFIKEKENEKKAEVEIEEAKGERGSLFTADTAEELANRLRSEIKAPVVGVEVSTLGGQENVSIIAKGSLDTKETWANGIFHNSRYFMFHIGNDGMMELFSRGFTIQEKFRKTYAKTADDVISKINAYLELVPKVNVEKEDNNNVIDDKKAEVGEDKYKKLDELQKEFRRLWDSGKEEDEQKAYKIKEEMDKLFNELYTFKSISPKKQAEDKEDQTAKTFTISGDELRTLWGNGKPLTVNGKEYGVHKMSYGDYFLEPTGSFISETEGFAEDAIWLEKIDAQKNLYGIEGENKKAEIRKAFVSREAEIKVLNEKIATIEKERAELFETNEKVSAKLAEVEANRKLIASQFESLQVKTAMAQKVSECRQLAEMAYEKGLISIDDDKMIQEVKLGKNPLEVEAQLEEECIAKQSKLLRSYSDEKVAGYKEMISGFHKTASMINSKKKANTLKTPFIASGELEEEREGSIIEEALRSRNRKNL